MGQKHVEYKLKEVNDGNDQVDDIKPIWHADREVLVTCYEGGAGSAVSRLQHTINRQHTAGVISTTVKVGEDDEHQ